MTKKEEVIRELEAKLGQRDQYGNWVFKGAERKYRIKVQSKSLRYEEYFRFGDGSSRWINVGGVHTYYYGEADVNKVVAVAERMRSLTDKPHRY